MKKKLLALTLAFAMLLTGCGAGDGAGSGSGSTGGSAKKAAKDPMKFVVAGQTITMSAENGFDDINAIPNRVVVMPVRTEDNKMVVGKRQYNVFEDGYPTDATVEEDEVYAVMPGTMMYVGSRMFGAGGQMKADNGYMFTKALNYSNSNLQKMYNFETNAAMYGFTLVNDFSYLGVTQDSEEKDILKAGFRQGYFDGSFYYIYSKKAPDYDEIEKIFKDLCEEDVTNAMINRDANAYLDYMGQYAMASGMNGSDMMKFDLGFTENEKYWKSFKEKFGKSAPDDAYKIYRMVSLAIGQQFQYLQNGDIDSFVIVEVGHNTDSFAYSNFEGNICTVYVVTDKENVASWPEKWGWEARSVGNPSVEE